MEKSAGKRKGWGTLKVVCSVAVERLGTEEGEDGAVEIGAGFDVGDVRGRDFGVGCVGDIFLEEVAISWRSAGIVSARDHERGGLDGSKV